VDQNKKHIDSIALIVDEKEIEIWSLGDGKFLKSFTCKYCGVGVSIKCIEIIDEKSILAGFSDGSIRIISIPDGKITNVKTSYNCGIRAFRYIGGKHKHILVAYEDGLVSLFGLEFEQSEFATFFANKTIVSMEKGFKVDGNNVNIIICSAHALCVWNYFEKKNLDNLTREFHEEISAFLKWDETIFVVGFVDGTYRFCDIKSEKIFKIKTTHKAPIVSFFRHKNMLFSVSNDGVVCQLANGKCKSVLNVGEKKNINDEECQNSQDEEDDNDELKLKLDEI